MMFKKALVGVDHSPAEESLLSCLPDLKRWGIESVTLAHVIRIGYAQGVGYGQEDEYRAWLDKDAAPLREAGLEVVISVTAGGAPADELLAEASAEKADIVIVGSRSHNFLHEVFLGSVAKEVIRQSEIPVLVERLEPTRAGQAGTCVAVCSRALDRVLLATDLSEQSSLAENTAVQLAARAGQIDCLTVLAEDVDDSVRRETLARHHELVRRMQDMTGAAGSRVEHGETAESIARCAVSGDYSLIIVGKHGQGWIKGKAIGSTAAKVCEIARRPVLMVPLQNI